MVRISLFLCWALTLCCSWQSAVAVAPVSFSREVRPILAKHCGACHGADQKTRKADLRLDTQEGLLHPDVVVAGDPKSSAMLSRLLTSDPEELMPPPEKGDKLTHGEIDVIRRWIAEGANYEGHWAFLPVEKPAEPSVSEEDRTWVISPIDAFTLHDMRKAGMRPAEAATVDEWLRRVTLDLTGLPPKLEEIEQFEKSATTNWLAAKEIVVERLLASAGYGERMANDWLDVARYADTYGRHEDADCVTWPYRDWLIKAFNENLPYDQFVLHQTAGDLLPNPSRDQLVATCFNRLPQQSNEAGSNPEEFRIDQVNDRVKTTAGAFLGLTMECSRCHDHKFDPITMRDYYGMSAFFNNIDELGLFAVFTGGVPAPSILLHEPADEKRLETLREEMGAIEASMQADHAAAEKRFESWLTQAQPPRRLPEKTLWSRAMDWFGPTPPVAVAEIKPEVWYSFDEIEGKSLKNQGTVTEQGEVRLNAKLAEGRFGRALIMKGDNAVLIQGVPEMHRYEAFSFGLWLKPLSRMERAVIVHRSRSGLDAASRGFELILEDMKPSFALAHFAPGNEIRIRHLEELPVGEWTHVACTYDGSSRAAGMRLYVNGEPVGTEVVHDKLYKDIVYRQEWGDEADKDGVQLALAIGGRFNDASFRDGLLDEFFFHRRRLSAPEVRQCALLPDSSQPGDWLDWYLREVDTVWQDKTDRLGQLRLEENDLCTKAVELMVMEEMKGPHRPTNVLNRGQFDQPGQAVEPDTPGFLPPFPEDAPRDRLGLARWLTARENPLTARVEVNRIWQMFFGRGLVETSEDFGLQGRLPDHPELLDWLAAGFMEGGWNVKALCRQIALSATYGQSGMPAESRWLAEDPGNAHLARGPRHRLAAEQLRDLCLACSGLLNPAVGGPSVKPYQPAGLWNEAGTQHTYIQDHGDKLYRRSMYSFWRRTMPPANMTVFDAPTREFCKVRRDNTTSPMQALVLMNDVQFLEAARCLATSLLSEPDAARVEHGFLLLASRRPNEMQARQLTAYLEDERKRFENDPEAAHTFLASTGESLPPAEVNEADLAATTMMVRLLIGFSETTFKP